MKKSEYVAMLNQYPDDTEIKFHFNREIENVEVDTGLTTVVGNVEIDSEVEPDGCDYENHKLNVYFR